MTVDVDRGLAARAILHENFFIYVCAVFAELHPGQRVGGGGYLEVMCRALEAGARGELRRQLINLPPRHLKSFCLLCLAAWMLGRDPTAQIITVSYGDELARALSQRFRQIIGSGVHRAAFAEIDISQDGDRMVEMRTTAGGFWRSATVGGPVTGFGGETILVDDLIKAQDVNSQTLREQIETFFEGVLLSRLNNPVEGVVIVCMQRLHIADISARLIETGEYSHLSLAARAEHEGTYELYHGARWTREVGDLLDPVRFPDSELDTLRARNAHVFASQYQQNPESVGTAMLDLRSVAFVDEAPSRDDLSCVMQFWDTAVSDQPGASYTVGITCGFDGERWYLLDLVRERLRYPRLREMVVAVAQRWRADEVIVERASSGQSLVQDLRAAGHHNVYDLSVHGSKETRFFTKTAFFESDAFAILRGRIWEDTLRRDLARFPMSDSTDIPDAMSLFADYVTSRIGLAAVATILNGGRRVRPSRPNRRR